jgi:hypothetical protein
VQSKPPLESAIEAAACRRARAAGWAAIKQGGPGNARGWPDRLFINEDALHVWIEFKRPGGKLTPLQEGKIADLQRRNCHVRVCFSADEAMDFLNEVSRPGSNFYPGAEGL